MNVIAKMSVSSVEDYGQSRKIKFSCVHDAAINKDEPENRAFTKATPSGEAWMTIDNRFVWDAFKPQSDYTQEGYRDASHYVVFIPCKDHSLDDVYRALAALDTQEDA
jgi:hypothetical protein